MEVYSTDTALLLVEADIVEAFEAGTVEGSNPVVWYQEVFLPAHEDILALTEVWYCHPSTFLHVLAVFPKCRELAPVTMVNLFRCAPVLVSCYKVVSATDNLPFEISRQGRVFFSQAYATRQRSC